jgi:hypothetical protein
MQPTRAPHPRRPLTVLLIAVSLSAVFLDYWEYSKGFHGDPDIWAATLRGAAAAPAQYRVGVLKTAEFLTLHSPLAMRHALALIDIVSLLIAAFVLRSLLFRSAAWRNAGLTLQWLGAASFLVLLQYALCWLIWYQRPETLANAALLALALWLSTHRLPVQGTAGSLLTALALIAVALAQGLTRADVGFTFNLGVALIALSGYKGSAAAHRAPAFALPRWFQFAASLAAAAASAGAQLYMMRIVYPHASYGDTPIFQMKLNVTDHIRIVPFVLFLVPTAWVAVQVAKRRFRPHPAQAGLLLGAALFICLWSVLGKIDEVRIFLPFSLALAPLTVEALLHRLAQEHRPSEATELSSH